MAVWSDFFEFFEIVLFELWGNVCVAYRLCMVRMGCIWVYHVCVLCVCYVGVGASGLCMHYVSVDVLLAGFGCEGYCGGFESGKNMITKYTCTTG